MPAAQASFTKQNQHTLGIAVGASASAILLFKAMSDVDAEALPLSDLTAVSPIDGRYGRQTAALRAIFSEFGLMHCRVQCEVEWLKALAVHPSITEVKLSKTAVAFLDSLVANFGEADAKRTSSKFYATEFQKLISGWREAFESPLLPFFYVECISGSSREGWSMRTANVSHPASPSYALQGPVGMLPSKNDRCSGRAVHRVRRGGAQGAALLGGAARGARAA